MANVWLNFEDRGKNYQSKMATMKEVAEEAGVSVTTVSHVINNTRYVSPELTQKVNQAIEKLDYHPNPLGRGLRKGESNTIALLVSDIANPFFPKVARGVEDCARENEYNLILCNTDEDPSEEKLYLSLLKAKQMDGFIVAPTVNGIEYLNTLVEEVPLVLIDRKIDEVETDQIFSDNFGGAYQAVKHLIDLGHENIGIILEITEIRSFADRLAGYKKALRENELKIKEGYIKQSGLELEGAYQVTKALLEDRPEITAIFSTNNLVTRGVLHCFKDMGVKCPDDVALVGFDDPDWAASFNPSITSVAQKPYEMGYKATEMLIKRINRQEAKPKPQFVQLETIIKVRESTGVLGNLASRGVGSGDTEKFT